MGNTDFFPIRAPIHSSEGQKLIEEIKIGDIADKCLGALKTGAKALREIGQAGLSQVDELAQTVSRFGRNAGQVADEVAAAAVDVGRGISHLDEGGLLTRSLDNFDADCGNSFTAGTPVETDEGQKPIEEIKVGDKVLAEDPETGEQGHFEVVVLTTIQPTKY